MPDDLGVALNNGNTGAKHGPTAFRETLLRYGTAEPYGFEWPVVFDAGDVSPGESLQETHRRVSDAAEQLTQAGLFPVGIGGGHDLTFAFVRGVAAGIGGIRAGVYLDAHLDVRDTEGSGMPFRYLVEHCGITKLDVVGLDPFANSHAHTDWFIEHGGRINTLSLEDQWSDAPMFVSVDLDAIDAAHAPGVSARNPAGMSPADAAAWASAAGRCDRVRCFDIMELCPPRDEGGRTARLAAHLFLSFLKGFAARNAQI